MQFLSQRDSLWASHKMGESDLTLGRWGCTTTAISMLSDYFGCFKTPLQLACNVNNYTKDGLVIWSNLNFDRMTFSWREYGCNHAHIKAALSNPDTAVILQVNDGAHWVVAYSTRFIGNNDYWIIDPWDGKKKKLLSIYRNITGAAYFRRKEGNKVVGSDIPSIQYKIQSRLIKGSGKEVYVFNGEKKFHIPDEPTARLLFGADWTKEIESIGTAELRKIETGEPIPSMKLTNK